MFLLRSHCFSKCCAARMGIINESAGQDRGSCHSCLIGVSIMDGWSRYLMLKAMLSSLRKAGRITVLTDATLRHFAPFKVYIRSHWISKHRVCSRSFLESSRRTCCRRRNGSLFLYLVGLGFRRSMCEVCHINLKKKFYHGQCDGLEWKITSCNPKQVKKREGCW